MQTLYCYCTTSSPCIHVSALVNTKSRRIQNWVFSIITIPMTTNSELCLPGFWWYPLWIFCSKTLSSYWYAHLQVIQVSLCAIREALKDTPGNSEKIFVHSTDEQLWTMRLTNVAGDHLQIPIPKKLQTRCVASLNHIGWMLSHMHANSHTKFINPTKYSQLGRKEWTAASSYEICL